MKTNDVHIALPTSKSISNRWLVLNYVTQSSFVFHNLSTADDTQLLQVLLQQLRHDNSTLFYCHNAGTVARFMLALLAITPGTRTLTGDDRLKKRPMGPLIQALRDMGCTISCDEEEGFLPVTVSGFVPERKMASIDPISSSQFVSAMLLIGPLMPNGLTLTLTGRAASRPYIEMTRAIIEQAGIPTSVSPNNRVYRVASLSDSHIVNHKIIDIERDWSSASYIYAAAALLPGIRLRMQGLSLSSCQGDSVTADIFSHLGVATREVRSPYKRNVKSITVEGTGKWDDTFEYNFLDYPDILPAVVTTCAALGIKARLKGAKNLRYKESDRLSALKQELAKMGIEMTYSANEAHIFPGEIHPTQPVDSHDDHRIAMAFAVLSLKYPEIKIANPETVSKSFPDFWQQLTLIRKAADQQLQSQASAQ